MRLSLFVYCGHVVSQGHSLSLSLTHSPLISCFPSLPLLSLSPPNWALKNISPGIYSPLFPSFLPSFPLFITLFPHFPLFSSLFNLIPFIHHHFPSFYHIFPFSPPFPSIYLYFSYFHLLSLFPLIFPSFPLMCDVTLSRDDLRLPKVICDVGFVGVACDVRGEGGGGGRVSLGMCPKG